MASINPPTIQETITLSDVFSTVVSPERFESSFVDSVAISDDFNFTVQALPVLNLEDVLSITDEFSTVMRVAPILNVEDTVNITDTLVMNASDRFAIAADDLIVITDLVTAQFTARSNLDTDESISISDVFLIQYGLNIINGSGDGSYGIGDIVNIIADTIVSEVFIKWSFNKVGIANVFSPNTTVTVPQGGGLITAEFFNLGALDLNFKDVVMVLDLNDFDYIESQDGDSITTSETISIAGKSMGVAQKDFTIEQGSVFTNVVIYRDADGNPKDLTGYTGEMQIRKNKASSTILLTMTTSNGYLALGGVNGTITFNVPADITDALDFNWGVYDLELYPNGVVANAVRLLEGKINLSKQVTR